MNFQRLLGGVGLSVVILSGTQLAAKPRRPAPHGWGTVEEAQGCEKEYADSKSWATPNNYPYPINDALKGGQVSPPCKAEIEKRAKSCMDDPRMQSIYNDSNNPISHKDLPRFWSYRAFRGI